MSDKREALIRWAGAVLNYPDEEIDKLCEEYKVLKAKKEALQAEFASKKADYRAQQEKYKKQYDSAFNNLLKEGYTPEEVIKIMGEKIR